MRKPPRPQQWDLSPVEVVELAELVQDAPLRIGLVDEILQAAEEHRGMRLRLAAGVPHRGNRTPSEQRTARIRSRSRDGRCDRGHPGPAESRAGLRSNLAR